MESNRKSRSGFKPPIKGGNASSKTHSYLTNTMDRVCHTVLSYCSEGNAEDHYDMDTQSLSMFSGERKAAGNEEAIGELDDLLFQLDDPFSDTHSSEKLDDPYRVLNDSFSLSGTHESPMISQDEEIATSDEQIVPGSPPSKCPELDGREGSRGRGGSMETEQGESDGLGLFPKRQFKVPAKSSRHYNLDLLPKHYRKGIRRSTTGGAKLSVNWAGNVSVLRDSSREKAGGREEAAPMGVYEVPLSAGDYRESSKPGRRSRNNQSLLRPDISLRSRTKEEQASHN